MPNTFELIASSTVGAGGSSTIEFTSIPSTYTDLCVVLSGRTTANADNYGDMDLSFNGAPSGTAYSWRRLMGNTNGNVVTSSNAATDDAINLTSTLVGSGATATTFSSVSVYVPNYTSSNNKSVSVDAVTENNASAQAFTTLYAGLWASSSAITSLRLTVTYGTAFAQHSTAYLYGVKNA